MSVSPTELFTIQREILRRLADSPDEKPSEELKKAIADTDKLMNFGRAKDYEDTSEGRQKQEIDAQKAAQQMRNRDIDRNINSTADDYIINKSPYKVQDTVDNLINETFNELQIKFEKKIEKNLAEENERKGELLRQQLLNNRRVPTYQQPYSPYAEQAKIERNLGNLTNLYNDLNTYDPQNFNYELGTSNYAFTKSSSPDTIYKPKEPVIEPKVEPEIDPVTGRVKRKFDLE